MSLTLEFVDKDAALHYLLQLTPFWRGVAWRELEIWSRQLVCGPCSDLAICSYNNCGKGRL
jgi:hypothetical protein